MAAGARARLPEFPSTSCGLTDEDDDGEDLGPVEAPHAVQPQRQHTVDPLWVAERRRSESCCMFSATHDDDDDDVRTFFITFSTLFRV